MFLMPWFLRVTDKHYKNNQEKNVQTPFLSLPHNYAMPSSIPVIKLLSVLCDTQAPLADAALSVFMEWPSGNSRALQDAYQMSTDTCSIQ